MDFKVSTFLCVEFILFYFHAPVFSKENKLKFCAVDNRKTHRIVSTECERLDKLNNKEVECVVKPDRISCLKLLLSGNVDFMTTEPEDLFVIGMTEAYNRELLVIEELRINPSESASLEMVVIVHKSVKNLWATEKTSLCLSGLELEGDAVDDTRYFQEKLLIPECDPRKTLLENRLSALSSYFEHACIAGPWTPDKNLNTDLKREFQNLCFNCKNIQNCSSEDEYFGREGSLLCLTAGRGDIAWVRAEDVLKHFQILNIDKNEYKFLCPDNEIRTLYDAPCVWISKPWRTIIARKYIAERVSKFVIEQSKGVDSFPRLYEEDLYRMPVLVDPFKTPNDFLQMFPEYYSLRDKLQCKPDRTITWCVTTNLEYRKCKWLSHAAQSRGVEPSIKCVQESGLVDCINSVKNFNSDMFVIKSLDEIEVKKKGLKPIVHLISNAIDHKNEVTALVKKFSNFKSLENLKYRKACFSGYRDTAWNAFIYIMRNLTGDNDWYCKDAKMVSQYFNDSCVVDLDSRNDTFPKNLYSICHDWKEETREKVALNCLSLSGDIAFLNLEIAISSYKDTFSTYYRPICVNESTSESKPEERCFLTWITLGSIMVHANISKTREAEIYLMLVELNGLFGTKFKGITPQISMYEAFEGKNNVIFPENTYTLERDADRIHRVPSYPVILEDIMNHRESCSNANSLTVRKGNDFIIIVSFFYFLVLAF